MLNEARAAETASAALAAAKAQKLAEINAAYTDFINEHSGADQVPQYERDTWPLQAAEAKAWAADKSAETPVLDRIAEARGIDAAKLKAAALKKTQAYEALTAAASGRRQALAEKVEKAKTLQAVAALAADFAV